MPRQKKVKLIGLGVPANLLKEFIDLSYKGNTSIAPEGYSIDAPLSDSRVKVYTKNNTNDKEVIVVHRGSVGLQDWLDNAKFLVAGKVKSTKTYKMHRERHLKAIEKYGAENIIGIGHSRAGLYLQELQKEVPIKEIITYNKAVGFYDALRTNPAEQTDVKVKNDFVSLLSGLQKRPKKMVEIEATKNPLDFNAAHQPAELEKLGETFIGLENEPVVGSGRAPSPKTLEQLNKMLKTLEGKLAKINKGKIYKTTNKEKVEYELSYTKARIKNHETKGEDLIITKKAKYGNELPAKAKAYKAKPKKEPKKEEAKKEEPKKEEPKKEEPKKEEKWEQEKRENKIDKSLKTREYYKELYNKLGENKQPVTRDEFTAVMIEEEEMKNKKKEEPKKKEPKKKEPKKEEPKPVLELPIPKPTPKKIEPLINKLESKIKEFEALGKKHGAVIYNGDGFAQVVAYIALLIEYESKCAIIGGKNLTNYTINSKLDNGQNTAFYNAAEKLSNDLLDCIQRGDKMIAIPLSLKFGDSTMGHANLLIYRPYENTIERFEPYGELPDISADKTFNIVLKRMFEVEMKPYLKELTPKFIEPNQICPNIKGFQALEEELGLLEQEGGGFCAMWSLFILELIFLNPTLSTKEIIQQGLTLSKSKPQYLRNVIRGYVLKIEKMLDSYVKKIGINDGFNFKTTNNLKDSSLLFQEQLLNLLLSFGGSNSKIKELEESVKLQKLLSTKTKLEINTMAKTIFKSDFGVHHYKKWNIEDMIKFITNTYLIPNTPKYKAEYRDEIFKYFEEPKKEEPKPVPTPEKEEPKKEEPKKQTKKEMEEYFRKYPIDYLKKFYNGLVQDEKNRGVKTPFKRAGNLTEDELIEFILKVIIEDQKRKGNIIEGGIFGFSAEEKEAKKAKQEAKRAERQAKYDAQKKEQNVKIGELIVSLNALKKKKQAKKEADEAPKAETEPKVEIDAETEPVEGGIFGWSDKEKADKAERKMLREEYYKTHNRQQNANYTFDKTARANWKKEFYAKNTAPKAKEIVEVPKVEEVIETESNIEGSGYRKSYIEEIANPINPMFAFKSTLSVPMFIEPENEYLIIDEMYGGSATDMLGMNCYDGKCFNPVWEKEKIKRQILSEYKIWYWPWGTPPAGHIRMPWLNAMVEERYKPLYDEFVARRNVNIGLDANASKDDFGRQMFSNLTDALSYVPVLNLPTTIGLSVASAVADIKKDPVEPIEPETTEPDEIDTE